jgi:hypothetical protein
VDADLPSVLERSERTDVDLDTIRLAGELILAELSDR